MGAPKKLLVVDVAAFGWELASSQTKTVGEMLELQPLATVFPAVTCTAQASFRTGETATSHGMVGNGLFFRGLAKPLFWEQSANLVEGERIWSNFRARGGRVGMMFWQQSLGEEVDLVLSPKPVHKHSGGMMQDCFSLPHDLYAELSQQVGRSFNLMHYWGPLASRKSSEWVVDATLAVLERDDAPELLMTYLPHLDYDLQRCGPAHPKAGKAMGELLGYLSRLHRAARAAGYEFLVFGDYPIGPVTGGAVFPNRFLREEGLFRTRQVGGRAYPDFFTSEAWAMVDHEVAHVFVRDPTRVPTLQEALHALPGVGEVLNREAQTARGVSHPRSGELILVAEEGHWFAYPWWTEKSEAPDFATHVDIHSKPGYDPCELFFGWPPPSVSTNTERIRGSHGRPGGRVAWASSLAMKEAPQTLPELARRVKSWLDDAE